MTPSQSIYLGFDLGASSGRAVLGFLRGCRLEIKEVNRFSNAPCQVDGRWFWDVPALWNNILSSMRLCAKQGHRRLSGVAVDTWGVDFGLLGADGCLLANPTCYRDPRTKGVEPGSARLSAKRNSSD